MKLPRIGVVIMLAAMGLAIAMAPEARAQQQKDPEMAPAAPVPAPIATATSVFIANGGVDGSSMTITKRAGDPNLVYNGLYAAMQKWGRFQLATTPAHADLILEIRFTITMFYDGKVTTYSPQVELTILDAKSHILLWTIDEPVEVAVRIATWERNINEGITNLVGDLQRLEAQPVAAPPPGND